MRILIADDSETSRLLLSEQIATAGHKVLTAKDGIEAVHIAKTKRPDLIMLDVIMPGLDGIETARQIKAYCDDKGSWIPIIFLSAMVEDEDIVRGIEVGGDDYLAKPISGMVLRAKLTAMERIVKMRQQLESTRRRFDIANRRLLRQSQMDGLTNIANRRKFDEHLNREWRIAVRRQAPLSIILCDIDHFKSYNDTYGHPAGDRCLQQVATTLEQVTKRPGDLVARYGGEEFAVILPETPHDAALVLAEKMRLAINSLQPVLPNAPVTASFGVGSALPELASEGPLALIEAADRALYVAKKQGRNRVVEAA